MDVRRDAIVVLPHLGPGGSQRVASILLNAWHGEGKCVTLVSLLDGPVDSHNLEAGIEHIRIQDVLRRERAHADASTGMAIHRLALRLPRLLGRYAALALSVVGLDLRAIVLRAMSPLLGPERYLTIFYPDTWRDIRRLRRLFLQLRPDVVLSFLAATNVKTILAARQIGQPVIVSERNDPAVQRISEPWQYFRERAYQWANLVTANSHGALETMKTFVPTSKLRHVPNPLLMSDTTPPPDSREPIVLAVGRLVEQKGFDILLEAFAKSADAMPGWTVEILGDGPLRTELERLAERLGVRNRVVFRGHTDDIPSYYLRAGIFVLPSRFEGMPNALLEAMLLGLPIIVSDASPGPLEKVTDGENGIVVPVNDVAALARAMCDLATCADTRRRMGDAGRKRVSEHRLENALVVWETLMEQARADRTVGPAETLGGV